MYVAAQKRDGSRRGTYGIGGCWSPSRTMKNEVPLTLEGASVLHQMFRVRWQAWKSLPEERRRAALEEATRALTGMEQSQSARFSLLGHKVELMSLHF